MQTAFPLMEKMRGAAAGGGINFLFGETGMDDVEWIEKVSSRLPPLSP